MRFADYDSSAGRPNVVVDGSPNAGTVLTLTHWPGIAQPHGLAADLSAQMAFRFIRDGRDVQAEIVTNNHFDQDGLVGIFALIDPATALAHEDLLVDVAAAGDFGTFRHRASARAAMAIAAFADGPEERSCAELYRATLDLLVPMVLEPERFEQLWADEDAALSAGEAALRDGRVSVVEDTDLDLVIVVVDPDVTPQVGRRFTHETHTGLHPMVTNNATDCVRVLEAQGTRYQYTDRYETWVQYRSRRPLPRVDLRPLAERLGDLDPGCAWVAGPPDALSPRLASVGDSGLERHVVVEVLSEHLSTAPPAWHPHAEDPRSG